MSDIQNQTAKDAYYEKVMEEARQVVKDSLPARIRALKKTK